MNVDDLILVSIDDHVVEPPDLWAKLLPPEFRNHPDTPKLVKDEEGGDELDHPPMSKQRYLISR